MKTGNGEMRRLEEFEVRLEILMFTRKIDIEI
jgi:hypothetical protein